MVNLDGAIYTKDGTIVKAFGLEPFFNPSQGSNIIDEMSDPVFCLIIYLEDGLLLYLI